MWWGGNVDVVRQDGSSISIWMSVDTVKNHRGRVIGFVVRTNSAEVQKIPGQGVVGLPIDPLNRLVHDMRNVFTAIELNLHLAGEVSADQGMQQRLTAIRDASRNGIELLDNALH